MPWLAPAILILAILSAVLIARAHHALTTRPAQPLTSIAPVPKTFTDRFTTCYTDTTSRPNVVRCTEDNP